MSFQPAGGSIRHLLRKGSIKFLVLNTLNARPMHGYEVAKEIAGLFNGAYEPSPGVIYPTLQWLADEGHVHGDQNEGKIVYTITASGKQFLKENEKSVLEALELVKGRAAQGNFPILRSARRLQRTIGVYLPEMSNERRIEVGKVLDEARESIERMMQE
jgi:DNA-binding PadR family transcriptional regulator